MSRAGTSRPGWRPGAPPLWVLAAGLMAVAAVAVAGGSRMGEDVDRLERAETLSFVLEARVYEQALLESDAAASGIAADGTAARRAADVRVEIAAALAELAVLFPDDPDAKRVVTAATAWQAAVDTELRLLAAGDLVAANRVNRLQVEPRFEGLAGSLRTTGETFDEAANTAQRRSRGGTLTVAGAAVLLALVLLWRVERARSRQRAVEEKARKERRRLVNKILSVTERQRSGMAVELHDGQIGRAHV